MDRQTLKELAEVEVGPAVSILCPLEKRKPGNEHDALLLRGLHDRAVEEIAALPESDAIMTRRVDDAFASLDLAHPGDGIAILVSPTVSRVLRLDAPVAASVVVGDNFALRALLSATTSPSVGARVIVLSQAVSRCVDIIGDDAVERFDCGFPVDVVPPTEADAPHRDFPLDEHEHAEAAKFVFRAVGRALSALERSGALPLVLVGDERDLAYFEEVAHRTGVIGRVHGNHVRETPDALARLVQPALDAYRQQLQCDACDDVREAIDSRAVAGIENVWLASQTGRGHRLVVEDGYRYQARAVDGTLRAASDGDSFDAVAQTVLEVVRHDGDVVAVPEGSISDLAHIALLTRF